MDAGKVGLKNAVLFVQIGFATVAAPATVDSTNSSENANAVVTMDERLIRMSNVPPYVQKAGTTARWVQATCVARLVVGTRPRGSEIRIRSESQRRTSEWEGRASGES